MAIGRENERKMALCGEHRVATVDGALANICSRVSMSVGQYMQPVFRAVVPQSRHAPSVELDDAARQCLGVQVVITDERLHASIVSS